MPAEVKAPSTPSSSLRAWMSSAQAFSLSEGVDVLGLVASLLEQLLVVNNAEALLNPVDTQILAVGLQSQGVVDELRRGAWCRTDRRSNPSSS